ncbi:MAG: hypothetical protein ACFHU9_17735 [Fluviicola sp.]
MNIFKATATLFCSSLLLTGCMTGKYVSKPTGENAVTQAPMKLKMCGKAQYTYYAYRNSAVEMYTEYSKFKKKGDTIYMRERTYYGDTSEVADEFKPKFVIMGDSLVSLKYEMAYVKEK